MRKIEIRILFDEKNVEMIKVANQLEFLKFLEDFEYFKSEGLAREVVKEVFALKDDEKFKVLRYEFSKKEVNIKDDFENQGKQEW